MSDDRRTKAELIEELDKLKRKVAKLEQADAERRQAEERLHKESAVVADIVDSMLRGELDDAATGKRVLAACLAATDSVYGMIGVINEHGKYDTTAYDSRVLKDCAFPEALAWEVSTGMTIRGIWGWPMFHGEPLVCNDLPAHPDRAGCPDGHVPIHCFLGVPLKRNGSVVGMVAVANKPGGYAEVDQGFISRLAAVMTVSWQHREAVQRVREHSTKLEAVNKELESFAYSVSHDLRAPLRAIGSFSQILIDEYQKELDQQGRDYLQRVTRAAERMSLQIHDLLELSRVTRAEMSRERVDLSNIARRIVSELQQGHPKRRASFEISDGMVTDGDPRLLNLAIQNLVENAWKFTGKRSDARIEFAPMEKEGKRVYFVRDNGVGFDMKYANKLFVPFQRLHSMSEFPGTGVGLATVLRVIHRHGGRVWAESELDQGATFYFTL